MKAQAAMEYLMTYGWAILIVVIVVAALYAMGVFTASPSVACSPCFSNFAYVDYAAGNLLVRNGPQSIDTITIAAVPDTGANATITPTSATSGDMLNITGVDATGDVEITLTYTVTSSGLTHTDSATVHN